jgi:hypothetical protein
MLSTEAIMRISPSGTSVNKSSTDSIGNNQTSLESEFSKKLEKASVGKPMTARPSVVSHEVLKTLAQDFKSGAIDKDQATSRFVGAVVANSVHGKLSEKDCEMIAKDIAEFFSDDPDFMSKLQKNLRDLA